MRWVSGTFFETWDPLGILPISYVTDSTGMIVWTKAGGDAHSLEEIEAEVVALLADH